jgi:hypothetical protein
MTPFEREQMKRHAEAKLAAMRVRAKRARHRVLTGAAVVFVVLWLVILAQMLTGHDPALGPATATMGSAAGERVATEPAASSISADHGEGEDDDDDEEDDQSVLPAPVEGAPTPVEEAIEVPVEEAEELEPATTGQS